MESCCALAVVSTGLFTESLDSVAMIDALVVLLLQKDSLTGYSCRAVLCLLAEEGLVACAVLLGKYKLQPANRVGYHHTVPGNIYAGKVWSLLHAAVNF